MSRSLGARAVISVAEAVDHSVGWHKLPPALGVATLIGLRQRLRQENLFDRGNPRPPLPGDAGEWERWRSIDGTYNDLGAPLMGSAHSRFGRNVALEHTHPEPAPGILTPDPFRVSEELLARKQFLASNLNVLAAAWIQFETHDWFDHGTPVEGEAWDLERPDWPEGGTRIRRTRPDPSTEGRLGTSATYASEDTHWWDGSQLYGRDPQWVQAIRGDQDDGKLEPPERLLANLEHLVDPTGSAANMWVGSLALAVVFALEHNAICDALVRDERRSWTSDELFHTARLINVAVMAKVHVLEWTPALLDHPALRWGSRINWWGALEPVTRRWGRKGKSDFLFGLPGSPTKHHGVPFSLTEEFVAVYRMHTLMPDDYSFVSGSSGSFDCGLLDLVGPARAGKVLERVGLSDAFYSLGIARSGLPALHNFPSTLQRLVRPIDAAGNEGRIDMAATDVLRDRERGVPRYNLFRELFHLPPVRSFEDLTTDSRWAGEIRDVYEGDIDRVDLQVGLLAEPRPEGFAISDTAFRVFLLMANRRLQSDRFFTADYTDATYTSTGLRWIRAATFKGMLMHHFPELEPALADVTNPFRPWTPREP
jgi:hypothetical protein